MKKARFIGVLMAAVMAVVPFMGTAKNIGFNSIEAKANGNMTAPAAGGVYRYGVMIDIPNNTGEIRFSSHDGAVLLWNRYCLLCFQDGVLSIRKYINGNKDAYYNTFYFNTGGNELRFQLDGNLVAYKNGIATSQTRTCNTYKSTNQGYMYQYVLTDDGRLLIYRYEPGYKVDKKTGAYKGKYSIIWDSSNDKMYRI